MIRIFYFRKLLTSLAILLLALAPVACERSGVPAPTGEVYKIAYINVVEREDSSREDDVLEGVLAANAAGAVLDNGDRLEVVHASLALTRQNWLDTASRYIQEQQISGILLGADSLHTLEIKADLEKLAVPVLAAVATHPDITLDSEIISQLSFDDNKQGQAAALFARDELLIRRVAVLFDEEDPYSGNLGQVFRSRFEQTGGVVTDFRSIAGVDERTLQYLRSRDTELLYLPVSARQVLEVVTDLDGIGWSPVLMGSDGLLASVLQNYPNRGYQLSGMYVTDLFTDPGESDSKPGFVQRIRGSYDDMYDDEINSDTALGVEAYRAMFAAVEACPDRKNTDCVNRSLRSGQAQRGVMSKISIQPNGKAKRPVYINTLINNQLKMVVKVN